MRSSFAPTKLPSLKTNAAGPSQGSCSDAPICRNLRNAGSTCFSRFPSGRNKPQHGGSNAVAALQQNLERIIKARRVADALFQRVEPILHRKLISNALLARAHPPAVGSDRIDLAIVRDESKRLRQHPGRPSVGGIALVKNGEGRPEVGAIDVGIKLAKLERREEAFVNDCPRRKRTKIDVARILRFDALAQQEEIALEIRSWMGGSEKTLANQREGGCSAGSKNGRLRGNAAPAQTMKPGLARAFLDGGPRFGLAAVRNEGHTEPEVRRQIDPALPRGTREKLFGNGEQQACAVAAQSVRVHAAAMGKTS